MYQPRYYFFALLSLLTSVIMAQTCPTVVTRVGITEPAVVATVGSAEADFHTFFVAGEPVVFPLSGSLETTTTTAFAYRSSGVAHTTGDYPFVAYPLVPDASATVTISQARVSNTAIEDISFTLFEGIFDPAVDNSARLAASTFTETGNLPALTATLTGGVQYTLVVQSGQVYDRPYPRNFTLTLGSTSELRPTFHTGDTLPDYYAYTYLALAGNSIAQVSAVGDFRDLTEGFYSIYGLAYDSREPLPTALTELASSCAQLSQNSQRILIAAEDDLPRAPKFTLQATARPGGVQLDWQLPTATEYDYFRIERSTDGSYWSAYTEVSGEGTLNDEAVQFRYVDTRPLSGTSFYRLVRIDLTGHEQLSTYAEAKVNVNSM